MKWATNDYTPNTSLFGLRLLFLLIFAASASTAALAQTDTTWIGGVSGSWSDMGNWSAGVPTTGNNAIIDGGKPQDTTVTTAVSVSLFVDRLTIDAGDSLVINNNTDFSIVTAAGRPLSGVIDNDGGIEITNAFNDTDLVIDELVTVIGSGDITLGGSGLVSRILDQSGSDGHLINAGNTIQGKGQIGANTLQLTNQAGGTYDANVSGQTLTVDPNATGMINQGTLRASNGGDLVLTDGALNNSGGTIVAADASTVTLTGSASVSGGTLMSSGTGLIQVPVSSTAFLADLTINGNVTQLNNTGLFIDGNINNLGVINVVNAFNTTDLVVDATTTLGGGGTVTLSGAGNVSRIVDLAGADGELINVDDLIQGQGQIGANTLQLTNQVGGTIDANANGQALTIDPNASGMINQGTLRASSGGNLVLSAGSFDNAGGTILAMDTSKVTLTGSAAVSGGTLTSSGSGLFEVPVSQIASLANLTINGTVTQLNNSNLFVDGNINNLGTINAINGFNPADIVVDSITTLSGGGTVTLSGSGNVSRILDLAADDGELINVDNLIQGQGQIGANTLRIVNQSGGLIVANDTTGALTIDPSPGGGFVNQGIARATAGAELALSGAGGGEFLNSGGNIVAEDDSTVRLTSAATVVGGNLTTSGTGQFLVAAGDTAALRDVTINGPVNVLNNSDLTLSGTITNSANTINISNGFNDTDLQIESNVMLTGEGTVTLSGFGNTSRILDEDGAAEGVLTNVNNTIEGQGQIGVNRMQLVNQAAGLIDANDPAGALILDPSSVAMINRGNMQASGGGQLVLTAGSLDNANGAIRAEDASKVTLAGSVVVSGGTLTSVGGGLLEVPSGQIATLADLTVNATVTQLNNTDLFLDGVINNTGTFNVQNGFNSTDIVIDTNTNLTGGGTVNLVGSDNSSRILDESGADGVLNNVNNTIQGKGQIGANSLRFVNQSAGVVDANNETGTLTLDPPASGIANQGLMRASGGGGLILTSGSIDNTGGTIVAADMSQVTLTGSVVVSGGTLTSSGSGTLVVPDGQTATLANLTNTGTVNQRNNTDLFLDGAIQNSGTINVLNGFNSTDLVIDTATSLTGGGNIVLGGSSATVSRILDQSGADGVLTNVNNTITGAGTIAVHLENQSAGLLHANNSNTLILSGVTNNAGTIRMDTNSTVLSTGSLSNLAGGVVTGPGRLDVDANAGGGITSDGLFAPGDSPGILTVEGNYTQSAAGGLEIEIAGTMLGDDYDQLFVDGLVSLDGSLKVALLGGFNPSPSDSFVIIDTSATPPNISVAGTFSSGNTVIFPGGMMSVVYNDRSVELTNFVAVPCDLDGNGACNTADMRILYDDIAVGAGPGVSDIDGSGLVDNDDIGEWLIAAGNLNSKVYLAGDTDLDGSVIGGDFTLLAANFGSSGLPGAYWDQGNFNGNLGGSFAVAGNDFTLLAANFGHTSLAAVPEPSSLWLTMLSLLAAMGCVLKRGRP